MTVGKSQTAGSHPVGDNMDDKTLTDLFESLSREIGALRQDVNDGVNRIESRVTTERDARIADLTRRLVKLEGKN